MRKLIIAALGGIAWRWFQKNRNRGPAVRRR
jgi:hypothetical protein